MTPAERMRSDALLHLRRDRQQIVRERAMRRAMVGAPYPPVDLEPSDARVDAPTAPGLMIPYSLRAIQVRAPRVHASSAREQSGIQTPRTGMGAASRPQASLAPDPIDVHSHLAAPDAASMPDFITGAAVTTIEQGWTNQEALSSQLQGMVILGNPIYDTATSGFGTFRPAPATDYWNTTAQLNLALAYHASHAGGAFFTPFAMVPHYDLEKPEAVGMVEYYLSVEGFAGIGEILVHGHGIDSPSTDGVWANRYIQSATNDRLIPYVRLAALHRVPLMFHWDFGSVDADAQNLDGTAFDGLQSARQLKELLDVNKAGLTSRGLLDMSTPGMWGLSDSRTLRAKIVIAHCGAGPNAQGWTDVSPELGHWYTTMRYLLSNYERVYFDIAGMQINDAKDVPSVQTLFDVDKGSLTGFGKALAELIHDYPTRFLFGLDGTSSPNSFTINDEMIGYTEDYVNYVSSELGITINTRRLYLENAEDVLDG